MNRQRLQVTCALCSAVGDWGGRDSQATPLLTLYHHLQLTQPYSWINAASTLACTFTNERSIARTRQLVPMPASPDGGRIYFRLSCLSPCMTQKGPRAVLAEPCGKAEKKGKIRGLRPDSCTWSTPRNEWVRSSL